MRELITDANFECSEDGIVSHRALENHRLFVCAGVLTLCLALSTLTPTASASDGQLARRPLSAIELRTDCFEEFRCDRPMSIGVSLNSLGKILKGANNDDVLSLKKSDDGDTLQMTFESPKSDRVGSSR